MTTDISCLQSFSHSSPGTAKFRRIQPRDNLFRPLRKPGDILLLRKPACGEEGLPFLADIEPVKIRVLIFFADYRQHERNLKTIQTAFLHIVKKPSHSYNAKRLKFHDLSLSCGRWDLNPHDVTTTRSLVLLVCQFRHFRVSGVSRFHISHRRILIYHSSICLASTFLNFFYFFNSIFFLLNLYYILPHVINQIR